MKRLTILIAVIVLLLVSATGSFLVGVYFGYENRPAVEGITQLYNKEDNKPAEVDFAPFWEAWQILEDKYVDTNGTTTDPVLTSQEKVWGAISGLTSALGDPYTVFLPPEEKEQFESDIQGNFSGVGMEIGIRNDQLTVISPLPDSPAKKAGIKAGDRIIEINGESALGVNTNEAVKKIRGEKGTTVRLTVLRGEDDQKLDISIVRDNIEIPTIETEMLESRVFVIRLYNFSAVSPRLFRDALQEFTEQKTDKLILDLRGNPGGYLDAAISVSSWFLPEDKAVVVEKRGDGEEEIIHYSKGYDVFNDKLKMVILIDQGSASASEIVAGALGEHGVATLIGQQTFGKGSVQELIPVTDDTSLKVTIARWYTPKGHSISSSGLTPDISVEITEEDINAGRDPQQDRAVEHLLNQ